MATTTDKRSHCDCCGSLLVPAFSKGPLEVLRCQRCPFEVGVAAVNANFFQDFEQVDKAYLDYLGQDQAALKNLQLQYEWLTREVGARPADVPLRVLDIGAGSGKWVEYLRQRGIEAIGLEPSQQLYQKFLAHEPSWFYCAFLEKVLPERLGQFDAITMFDVVEHLENPRQVLAAARNLLKPQQGILLISTPNNTSLFARICGKYWHFYHVYHLSYFCPTSLDRLLVACGYKSLGHSARGKYFNLKYLLLYAANFIFGRQGAAPKWLERVTMYLNLGDITYSAYAPSAESLASVASPAAETT